MTHACKNTQCYDIKPEETREIHGEKSVEAGKRDLIQGVERPVSAAPELSLVN